MAPASAAPVAATTVSDSQVVACIHAILKGADLEKITVRNLQRTIEKQLNVSLEDRKQFIRDEVEAFLKSGAAGFKDERLASAAKRKAADALSAGAVRAKAAKAEAQEEEEGDFVTADAMLETGPDAVVESAEGRVETLLELRRFAADLETAVAAALKDCQQCSMLGDDCECVDPEEEVGDGEEATATMDADCKRCQCAAFGVCGSCDDEEALLEIDVYRCTGCEEILCGDCDRAECEECEKKVCTSCETSTNCGCSAVLCEECKEGYECVDCPQA